MPAEESTTVDEDPQERSDLTADQIEAEAENAIYKCVESGCMVYGDAKGGLTECERLGCDKYACPDHVRAYEGHYICCSLCVGLARKRPLYKAASTNPIISRTVRPPIEEEPVSQTTITRGETSWGL